MVDRVNLTYPCVCPSLLYGKRAYARAGSHFGLIILKPHNARNRARSICTERSRTSVALALAGAARIMNQVGMMNDTEEDKSNDVNIFTRSRIALAPPSCTIEGSTPSMRNP